MAIDVRCVNPACGKALRVKEELAGKRVKCPACGKAMVISARPLSPTRPAKPTGISPPVAAEFQRRRACQIAIIPGALLAIAVLGLLAGPGDWPRRMLGRWEPLAFAVPVLVILALAAFSFFNWRCPSCRRYLGPVLNVPACRNCGAAFQTDPVNQATQTRAGDLSRQGIAGWLLVPAGALVAIPLILFWWWGRHVLLIADLKQRGFSYDSYVAGHYHLAGIDGVGGALVLVAATFVGFFFFRKHRRTPPLYIAFLVLGLVFSLVRFGMMWSLLGTKIAASRYEFYEFRAGSSVGILLASQLGTALLACLIGIPYFLRSRRVRATFVR